MKLYFSPGACSLAPHIVLQEAGLPAEIERVDLRSKKTATGADYMAINPKGYVPALQLDDGELLTEVTTILQYLADLAPQSKLAPAFGTIERYRLLEWLNFIATEVHKGFAPTFNPKQSDDAKKLAVEGLRRRFDYLQAQLKGHDYLMGKTFTVADGYLFTTLRWTKYVGIDLEHWPVLAAYVARIGARPSVLAAVAAEKAAPAP